MRELGWPAEVVTDPKATEMARVWIANKSLHVTMLLGMWADALESEIDERDAWGELLADLTRHIANGLVQSHGWDQAATVRRIARAYHDHISRTEINVEGAYEREGS
jgi:predicted secreted Zn-dependent protease